MKDTTRIEDAQFDALAAAQRKHPLLRPGHPARHLLQTAAHFSPRPRSYWAKYPGAAGRTLKQLTSEMLHRLATMQPHATVADVQAKGVQAFVRIDKGA